MTKQGPVLHQTQHQHAPPVGNRLSQRTYFVRSNDCSAANAGCNWPVVTRIGNATLTVAIVLALSALMAMEPAVARSRHHRGQAEPAEATHTKPQDRVAAPQLPLPRARPAEAPARASTEAAKDIEQCKGAD